MEIQWLGHAAFKVSIGEARILFDPFLRGNPKFSGDFDQVIAGTTHIFLTHAHNDHFGDAIDILKQTRATLVANFEICSYVATQYVEASIFGMNYGGTATIDGIEATMTRAYHSSSYTAPDGRVIYGGNPGGFIVRGDGRSIYHMGDTSAFSDMALIDELHHPEIGIVPMGGCYTMGAAEAAMAVDRWFHFKAAIPCHWGTFPMLAQSPDAFVKAVNSCEVWAPKPMEARKF